MMVMLMVGVMVMKIRIIMMTVISEKVLYNIRNSTGPVNPKPMF